MLKSEADIRLRALAGIAAGFHKSEVLSSSRLPVERLSELVSEIHRLAMESGLRIEVLATPDMPRADYRTTTLRVLSDHLCVLSRTLR
jgi:hypothetical protein